VIFLIDITNLYLPRNYITDENHLHFPGNHVLLHSLLLNAAFSIVLMNSPRCIAGVCESQVSGAQLVEHSQDTQAGADGMSALHANETRDLASPMGLFDSIEKCFGKPVIIIYQPN